MHASGFRSGSLISNPKQGTLSFKEMEAPQRQAVGFFVRKAASLPSQLSPSSPNIPALSHLDLPLVCAAEATPCAGKEAVLLACRDVERGHGDAELDEKQHREEQHVLRGRGLEGRDGEPSDRACLPHLYVYPIPLAPLIPAHNEEEGLGSARCSNDPKERDKEQEDAGRQHAAQQRDVLDNRSHAGGCSHANHNERNELRWQTGRGERAHMREGEPRQLPAKTHPLPLTR